MTKPGTTLSETCKALRELALRYPEAVESIACEGTAAERSTVKARNKAFLFFGAADMMVKLGDSLADATELAAKKPDQCKVGAHGWVTVKLAGGASPPLDLLEQWLDESYRLNAGKQLVAKLPVGPPAAKRKSSRKTP